MLNDKVSEPIKASMVKKKTCNCRGSKFCKCRLPNNGDSFYLYTNPLCHAKD